MPRQPVPSAPPAPRPVNLLTSARRPDDGLRWESGISLLPESCNTGWSYDGSCEVSPATKDDGTAAGLVEWDPYTIGVSEACDYALNDDTYSELAAKARRSLDAQTSHLVESIFWTNDVNGADFGATHPNIALIDTTDVGTPAPPTTALMQMEQRLITALGGRRGMIHIPAPLFHFFDDDLIQRNGNIWETSTGNIVVPGTGYTGSAPDGTMDSGVLWIYGTSMVEVRLSEIVVLPGDIRSAVDRATNQIVVRAERLALAYWDLCAHVGVPVCTTDPGPDCGPVS